MLVFTGLSVALAFRASIFNIGTQGQLVVGALATALAVLWAAPLVSGVVGTVLPVPLWLAVGAVFGGPNSEGVRTPPTLAEVVGGVPIVGDVQATLAAIPFLGALFDANVTVYLTFLMVALSWYALYRTRFGRWVRASGENPGRSTRRASASVASGTSLLLSGVLSGMGGASLSLSLSQFTGNGATMVNGKGFVAIVAYLFGNYNPVGAFLSTLLFAGLDAIQNALQIEGVGVPGQLAASRRS